MFPPRKWVPRMIFLLIEFNEVCLLLWLGKRINKPLPVYFMALSFQSWGLISLLKRKLVQTNKCWLSPKSIVGSNDVMIENEINTKRGCWISKQKWVNGLSQFWDRQGYYHFSVLQTTRLANEGHCLQLQTAGETTAVQIGEIAACVLQWSQQWTDQLKLVHLKICILGSLTKH